MAAKADDPSKVWALADLVARGEKVYAANCAACHQPDGKGGGPIKPLDGSPVVLRRRQGQADPGRAERPAQRRDAVVEAAVGHRHRRGDHLHQEQLVEQDRADRAAGRRGRRAQVTPGTRQEHREGIPMSAVIDHPATPHGRPRRPCPRRPHGWRRWVFATNHKDIGTMYLLFAFTMLMVGGVLALLHPRRAVPAGPAVRQPGAVQPAHHDARPDHGVRRDHAGLRRLRELDGAAADRRARHGVRAHEQPELLAADPGGHDAGRCRSSCPAARRRPAGRSTRR